MNALEQINRLVKQAQVGTLAGLKLPTSAFQPGTTPPRNIFSLPLREFNKYWQQREQNSPLKKMKPIDYFSQYKGSAPSARPASPSAAQTVKQTAKQPTRNDLTASRQAVVMPKGTGIKGSGWTGREVVQGGSAPVSRVDPSAVKPFNAIHGMSAKQIASLPSMQMMNRMDAEGAAYAEILQRLNRNGGDPRINAQNAKRLAPLVAKNYRRQADGTWKSISRSGDAQAKQVARKMTPSVGYRA